MNDKIFDRLKKNDPLGDTTRVYVETSGAGHAWISTGEGKKGQDAADYNQEKFDETGATVCVINDVKDEAINKILYVQFNSSDKMPEKGKYANNPSAHITGDYKLLSCNCTTTVGDALNLAGSHSLENIGNGATGPIKQEYIVPINLGTQLKWQANSFLGNGSVKVQAIINPKTKEK